MKRHVVWGITFGVYCATTPIAHAQNVAAASESANGDVRAAEALLNRRVSVTVREMSLNQAIQRVAGQVGVSVRYRSDIVDRYHQRVSLSLTDVSLRSVFAQLFAGTTLEVVAWPKSVLVITDRNGDGAPTVRVDSAAINGRVVDSATGKPIPGVSVRVQGTRLGATTTADGVFQLARVPVGELLLAVRSLGYRPRTVAVTAHEGEGLRVPIVLAPSPNVLSGVVTTAAGTQRRLEVGNDITTIRVDSVMQIAPVATVTDLLATRVPGLIVLPSSGIPGAPSRLRLRGVGSVSTSNDPIVVVDGARVYASQSGPNPVYVGTASPVRAGSHAGNFDGPSPLDQIDPNSIATIEVLKGPSASALYGSDAANGVIVITTKRGQVGPVRVSVAADAGLTTQPGDWPLRYYRFGHHSSVALGSDGRSALCNPYPYDQTCITDSVVAFQALNDDQYSPIATGADELVSATVSGGTSALAYALTGSTRRSTGLLRLPRIEADRFETVHGFSAPEWIRRPDRYTTWSGSSGLEIGLGRSGGSVSLTNALFNSTQRQSSLNANSVLAVLSAEYIDPALLGDFPLLSGVGSDFTGYFTRAQFKSLKSTNAVNATYPLLKALTVNANVGFDVYNIDNNTVTPNGYRAPTDSGGFTVQRETDLTRTLNASTVLPIPHAATAVGINVTSQSQTSFSATAAGLPPGVLNPTTLNNSGVPPAQTDVTIATYGWYMQPTFNVASRLFMNPGFRLDGGSASGSNAGLSLFPKIDVSWIALDRESDPLFGAITQVRPRVAFGIAGVQPGPSDRLRLFTPGTVATPDGGSIAALYFSSLGNTQLHPERSRELEGGFDILLGQRVSLNVTGFSKTRYDALLALPVAPSVVGLGYGFPSGLGPRWANIGTVRNVGWNASVNATLLDTRPVAWDVTTHVQSDQNRVLMLAPGLSGTILAGDSQLREGYPLYGLFVRPILGYADANYDGVLAPSEVRLGDSVVYVGQNAQPKYEMDLSTTFAFLNRTLRFNTAISVQNGLTQQYGTNGNIVGSYTGANTSPLFLSLNQPGISLAEQALVAACGPSNPNQGAFDCRGTRIGLYQTVNIVRWTSAAVTYLVPDRLAKTLHASSASLSLQGANLGLHTNYRGKDPSVSSAIGDSNSDMGQLPLPRSWRLRLQLGL